MAKYKPLKCRFAGQVISAIPLELLENGNWSMRSMVKHPRFDVGHVVHITPQELIDKPEELPDAVDA